MDGFLATIPSLALKTLNASRTSYEMERQVVLRSGVIEVGKFRWPSAVSYELRSEEDRLAFNLALSPRPSDGRIVPLNRLGSARPAKLDRVMFLKPGCAYRLTVPAGSVRTLCCVIDRRELERLLEAPADLQQEDWEAGFRARLPVIELLLNRMYEEVREEHFAEDEALEAYSRALCIELARCLHSAKTEAGLLRKGGLAPWRLRLLTERVCADAPAPSLPELAGLCGMSVRQLSRAFKEEYGKSLGKFVVNATIDRAVKLLTQTDLSIAEISAGLGFSSPASFTYAFRRVAGVLPKQARKRAVE